MNEFIQTQGIVIGKRDYLEADKIITVLTPDMGKIEVKAKGLRRTLAKMGGHLELFNHVELQLVSGRTFYIVTGAQAINSFTHIKQDFAWMSYIYYATELTQAVLKGPEEGSEVYASLLSLLSAPQEASQAPVALTVFEAQLWNTLGLRPELAYCVECREGIVENQISYSTNRGGVLCVLHAQDPADTVWAIGGDTLKMMRLLYSCNFDLCLRVKCNEQAMRELRVVFDRMAEYHVVRKIKSRDFMSLAPVAA